MQVGFAVATLLGLISTTTPGSAAPITFVASNGSDANPCTRALPCASFFGAGGVTDPGGILNCLDSGPYGGNVLFSKSITIDCPGGIYRPNFTGVSEGSGVLRIRGLTILGNGAASGSAGLLAGSGATLIVENCIIEQFTGAGISIQQGAFVDVTDTAIINNQSTGISVTTTGSGSGRVVLTRVLLQNNNNGAILRAASSADQHVSIEDSTISGNAGYGVYNIATGSARSIAVIKRSVIADNGASGIRVENVNGLTFLSKNTVTGNNIGLESVAGGGVVSYGDNNVNLNTTNGAPTGVATEQ